MSLFYLHGWRFGGTPWREGGFLLAGCFDFTVRLWLLFIRQICIYWRRRVQPPDIYTMWRNVRTMGPAGLMNEKAGERERRDGSGDGGVVGGGSWEICLCQSRIACQANAARSCLKSPDQYQVDFPHDFPNQAKRKKKNNPSIYFGALSKWALACFTLLHPLKVTYNENCFFPTDRWYKRCVWKAALVFI